MIDPVMALQSLHDADPQDPFAPGEDEGRISGIVPQQMHERRVGGDFGGFQEGGEFGGHPWGSEIVQELMGMGGQLYSRVRLRIMLPP